MRVLRRVSLRAPPLSLLPPLDLTMAISLDPLPPSAAPATLLATLRAFTAALETRRSLQAELDSALSSFLTSTPAPLFSGPDALAPAAEPATTGASACASEAVRPPSQDELNEVLRIGFGGLVELKEEVRLLREAIETRWHRADLAGVLGRIEEWESERIKAVRRLVRSVSLLRAALASTLSTMSMWRSLMGPRESGLTRRLLRRPSSETKCDGCRLSNPSWNSRPRSKRRMHCACRLLKLRAAERRRRLPS